MQYVDRVQDGGRRHRHSTDRRADGEAVYRLRKRDAVWTLVRPPGVYVVTAEFAGYAPLGAPVTVTPPVPMVAFLGTLKST
ncbi:hypothetical protein Spa11_25140 [Botrimarina mediterranea]|uniref:Uncharacterized protein n=1 Tax=Botrimarina mediterranea TaxID=2528022 RepID=A0A518K938_9BACT|nr:hypothetical protein Spa11_25140 [Botrimarina mediterranea]